ncbi:MAG: hypothetical protein E7331_12385 [Clostridiales bacterium]|nr:hypothetical protein [Clostridiales bacterium]
MLENQRKSLGAYYEKTILKNGEMADRDTHEKFLAIRKKITDGMDAFVAENPHTPSVLLKSRLHSLMAEHFEPVIFAENPFFFEMGLREADSWGLSSLCPAGYVRAYRERELHREHPILLRLEAVANRIYDMETLGLCQAQNTFDGDHHTLGYTELFRLGVRGLEEKAKAAAETAEGEAADFCRAAAESCQALCRIAERFGEKASQLLETTEDEKQQKYLKMMADITRRIPAQPPQTFAEGLSMLLFTREAVATLEGIGVSQLGHVDRLLGPLYEKDLTEGRLTEEEARELVGIWMLHTDIKFDLHNASWPETSTCIQLGGCDEEGLPVYNAVTRLFIREHHRLGLVNPKLNCRYNAQSPTEYLEVAGEAILAGHNNFVMINDDVIIRGLMGSGVAEKDARLYVSGGCQETMIEGCGHTEGVAFYASMPRVMDLFLCPDGDSADFVPVFEEAESFGDFIRQFIDAMDHFFSIVIDQRNMRQHILKDALVCPLFSVTQKGCIDNGRDYTSGGARYNFSTISLTGLGTVADSLYAIKKLVYDDKACTMKELIAALSANWEGWEELHRKAVAAPKYGHNHKEADQLANDFLRRIAQRLKRRRNERGGMHIPSLFVYYHFESFARVLRATPDGRKAFDLISPGAAPGQLQPIRDVTEPVKSMQRVDFTACGGGSCVLDVKLPLTSHMTPALFAAFIRACGDYGCPTLQPNVVSQEELLDARAHPEKHRQLIVRICGLSAYFVALTPEVQEEIIARNLYEG